MVTKNDLESLVALLNLKKKKEVKKYCRDLVIRSEDLSSLILAGRVAGIGPYKYACHFLEAVPEHLNPSAEELEALGRNGVGQLKGVAKKASNKIFQVFLDRRMLAVHLFYTPSQKYWHLFYFDQRDAEWRGNHWKHGPHIHYSQDTFTREPLAEVWAKACGSPPSFPASVHVRYDYHHNRRRRHA